MGKIFVGITFLFVLQIFLVGLVVGALARLFIPGPNPMTWGRTSLIGIIGALVGGFISGIFGLEGTPCSNSSNWSCCWNYFIFRETLITRRLHNHILDMPLSYSFFL